MRRGPLAQLRQLRPQPAVGVEKLLRPVALHPAFQDRQVPGLVHVADRDLVRAERPFDRQPVDLFRPGPALGRAAARSWASADAG